jgi:hypothetical protein
MPAWLTITGMSGWAAAKFGGGRHLRGIELQVERQAVLGQQGVAGPPRIAQQQVGRPVGLGRVLVPVDDLAHAANIGPRRMGLEQGLDAGIVKVGAGHDAADHPARLGQALQPVRLGQLVLGRQAALDVDGLDDVPPGRVGQVVVQPVGAIGDRRHVAGRVVRQRAILEPAIVVPVQVPQVHVRVDDRAEIGHRSAFP